MSALIGVRRRHLLALGVAVSMVALAAGGIAVTASARAARIVTRAEVDGVALQIRNALWLDHGEGDPTTTSHGHLPGMPDPGIRRLAVAFTVENVSGEDRRFTWQSLALRWPHRSAFAATRDGRASVALPAGHAALLEAWFDVPESEDLLTLGWEPGGQSIRLLTTRTPVHAAIARSPRVEWPPLAAELPDGRAARGQRLFDEKCASCHGDPTIPGSSIAAPHLAGIGVAAATRVPGETAAQYLYQSMIDPDAYRARTCAGRDGCEEPPPMPPYGEVLSPQDASDLVAYLLLQGKKP